MSGICFSLVANHAPWREERVVSLREMMMKLTPYAHGIPYFCNDKKHDRDSWRRGEAKVEWELAQWRWSLEQPVSHHVFMSDDLHVAPDFWEILDAMVRAAPAACMGMLSNHPRAVTLASEGWRWYRTNAWLVGPCIVLAREHLESFLAWFERLPPEEQRALNDDSTINRWISEAGPKEALHPLPTIIEHRHDIETTAAAGDQYSRERVSWRAWRTVKQGFDAAGRPDHWDWSTAPKPYDLEAMKSVEYWQERGGPTAAPMLPVGPE